MWNDPEYTLASAREHQRDIAREIEALRASRRPATALDEVVRAWILAVRTTGAYVRGSRSA
jgi:hypothetical protein